MTNKFKKIVFASLVCSLGIVAAIYNFRNTPEKSQAQPWNDFLRDRGEQGLKRKMALPLVSVYEKELKQFPQSMDLKKKLALAYFEAGKFDEARPLLIQVNQSSLSDAKTLQAAEAIDERMVPDSEKAAH